MQIEIDRQVLKSLLIMGAVVEARDPYTGGHLWRVSQLAKLLGTRLGLDRDTVAQVGLGGYLHDLGKVGVPDAILRKPAALTEHEFEIIKTHPLIGESVIREHPLAALVVDPIRHHHERVNGSGYPDRLGKEAISLHAKIIAIVDAFDAMTSARPYHQGMPIAEALVILMQARERDFDGDLVEGFVALGRTTGALEDIVLHSDEGVALVVCPTCGPVIAVPRIAQDGDIVYCRVCGSEHRLHRRGHSFVAEATGGQGGAREMRPVADVSPIDDLIKQVPRTLAAEAGTATQGEAL